MAGRWLYRVGILLVGLGAIACSGETQRGDALLPWNPLGTVDVGEAPVLLRLTESPAPLMEPSPLLSEDSAAAFPPGGEGVVELNEAHGPSPAGQAPHLPGGDMEADDLLWVSLPTADRPGPWPHVEERDLIQLSPGIPGRWLWLDSQRLLFEPAQGRLPFSSRITGTFNRELLAIPDLTSFTVSTPSQRVVDYGPVGVSLSRVPLLYFAFDQAVDAASVLDFISLDIKGHTWPLQLASQQELEGPEVPDLPAMPPSHRVVFRPAEPLPPEALVHVQLKPGAAGAEGSRRSDSRADFSFTTRPTFSLLGLSCEGEPPCPPDSTWSLEFSDLLDPTADPALWVEFSPRVPSLHVLRDGRLLKLRGEFEPGRDYQVRLSAGLSDALGQRLTGPERLVLPVGEEAVSLKLPESWQDLVSLTPTIPQFPVWTAGFDRLEVSARSVDPAQFSEFQTFLADRHQQVTELSPPGEARWSTTQRLGSRRGRWVEVDLTPALPAGKGHLLVTVRAVRAGAPERVLTRTVWVQVSEIAAAAHADGSTVTVWAREARGGAPLVSLPVRLLVAGVSGHTDREGVLRLPRPIVDPGPAPAREMLLAQLGDDQVLVPVEGGDLPGRMAPAGPDSPRIPPAGQVNLVLPHNPVLVGDSLPLHIRATWEGGVPAVAAEVEWRLRPRVGVPPGALVEGQETLLRGVTSVQGTHHSTLEVVAPQLARPLVVDVQVTVSPGPGVRWTTRGEITVNPSELLLKLSTREPAVVQGQPVIAEVELAQPGGGPLPGRKVVVHLSSPDGAEVLPPCRLLSGTEVGVCRFVPPHAGVWRMEAATVDRRGRRSVDVLSIPVVGQGLGIPEGGVDLHPLGLARPGTPLKVLLHTGVTGGEGLLTVRLGTTLFTRRFEMDGPVVMVEVPVPDEVGLLNLRADILPVPLPPPRERPGRYFYHAELELEVEGNTRADSPETPGEERARVEIPEAIPLMAGDEVEWPVVVVNPGGVEVPVEVQATIAGGTLLGSSRQVMMVGPLSRVSRTYSFRVGKTGPVTLNWTLKVGELTTEEQRSFPLGGYQRRYGWIGDRGAQSPAAKPSPGWLDEREVTDTVPGDFRALARHVAELAWLKRSPPSTPLQDVDKVEHLLQRSVATLLHGQAAHGGFFTTSYPDPSDLATTLSVAQGLVSAREAGLTLPPDLVDGVCLYLGGVVDRFYGGDTDEMDLATRVEVLWVRQRLSGVSPSPAELPSPTGVFDTLTMVAQLKLLALLPTAAEDPAWRSVVAHMRARMEKVDAWSRLSFAQRVEVAGVLQVSPHLRPLPPALQSSWAEWFPPGDAGLSERPPVLEGILREDLLDLLPLLLPSPSDVWSPAQLPTDSSPGSPGLFSRTEEVPLATLPQDLGLHVVRDIQAVDEPSDVRRLNDGRYAIRQGARVRVDLYLASDSPLEETAIWDGHVAGLLPLTPTRPNSSQYVVASPPPGPPPNPPSVLVIRGPAGLVRMSWDASATWAGQFSAAPLWISVPGGVSRAVRLPPLRVVIK